MPQDGANNYYYPPGTPGIPDQTIESEAYNTFLDDLVLNDLNVARPIHRGGTGATTASEALINLQGEISKQFVTNFDSHVWVNGSFASNTGASAAPPSGGTADAAYIGTYIAHVNNDYAIIEARSLTTGLLYVRVKTAGTWSAWSQQPTTFNEFNANYVNVTGDTITGGLTVTGAVTLGSLNVTGALQQNGYDVWTTANLNPNNYVPLWGGTMSGALHLAPGSTTHTPAVSSSTFIATTAYVEDRANAWGASHAAGRVAKTGDTMSGDLTLSKSSAPTTGQINFGNAGYSFYFDGTSWVFNAGVVYAPGVNVATGIFTGAGHAIYGTGNYFNSAGILAASGFKPGGGPWSDSSDSRIKNILGDYIKGLDDIRQLTPKVFTYKGNDILPGPDMEEARKGAREVIPGEPNPMSSHYQAAIDGKEFTGLIAQEVEVLMPELVTKLAGSIDGASVTDLRALDTGPLFYALINAVKELAARVEQLEAV